MARRRASGLAPGPDGGEVPTHLATAVPSHGHDGASLITRGLAPGPHLSLVAPQTTLRLLSSTITRHPSKRDSCPSRFQRTILSTATGLPRSTSHSGSVVFSVVWVTEFFPQSPLVLPSTARPATPPWSVLFWTLRFCNATLVAPLKTCTSASDNVRPPPGSMTRT